MGAESALFAVGLRLSLFNTSKIGIPEFVVFGGRLCPPARNNRLPLPVSMSFCYSSFLRKTLEDHLVCRSFVPSCVGAVVQPPSLA
jgi:hypothetical protein